MSVDTYWKTLQSNPLQTHSSDKTSTFLRVSSVLFLLLFYFIFLFRIENMIFAAQECICSCNLGCN